MQRLLEVAAAAAMLAWKNSGFSIDASGRIARIRYALPRHKAANWVGPGRGRTSTRPGANTVVETEPGPDPEDPHTPRRATRASAHLSRPRPAHRLGRTRADP